MWDQFPAILYPLLTVSVGVRCQVLRKWACDWETAPSSPSVYVPRSHHSLFRPQSLRNVRKYQSCFIQWPALAAKYLPSQASFLGRCCPFVRSILGPAIGGYVVMISHAISWSDGNDDDDGPVSVYQSWIWTRTCVYTQNPAHMWCHLSFNLSHWICRFCTSFPIM